LAVCSFASLYLSEPWLSPALAEIQPNSFMALLTTRVLMFGVQGEQRSSMRRRAGMNAVTP
jgi:hypothetical protein